MSCGLQERIRLLLPPLCFLAPSAPCITHHCCHIVAVSGDLMSDYTTYIVLQIVPEFVPSFTRQLLARGYQEIWYTPDGARKSSSPANTGHCFYHGAVRGFEGSSVAVSTFRTGRPATILPCTYHDNMFSSSSSNCLHFQEKRDLSKNMKYVEMLIVADKAEFEKHGSSLEKTKVKLLEAANLVDKYYKALNIRVALIGLEVWTSQDLISVSDNPHSTLAAFLSWRRKQLRVLPNDNAQLITGKSFQGTTIGLAPLKAMCSDYQSGGVNTDHSESAVGVAATMAHEMGHNFGMSHDSAGCCQARAEDGGCIMAAATGHPFPRVFNGCNEKELKSYLSSGGGKCLFNLPNTRAMYGGQRCGNGYLEDGEECDCGEEEECTSPCCNASNCTLKAGAECAHGICCDNCKLKSPGVLCRAPSGACDLPEYCDGKAESCPANFYLVDGTTCAGRQAYCYTGMCLTLEQQCLSLWGRDGRPAPDLCFKKVNEAGDMYGNCGKDHKVFISGRDAKCGKIQCLTSASERIQCMGTHVYKHGAEEVQGDTLDPGLVMTGTKCDDDSICFNGECRNASFLRADECNAKCHGHGLCNNNHNCHCDPGWAPPLCDQTGSGGSVDSGPVISHSETLHNNNMSVYFFETILLPHSYLVYSIFFQAISFQSCWSSLWFSLCFWLLLDSGAATGISSVKSSTSSPSSSTRPRHAIVRPAVKPPLVPFRFAAEQKQQTPEPQVQPVSSPERRCSPQARTPPPLRSALLPKQRQTWAPPPPAGPPPLPSQDPKSRSRPSAVPKPRPDPPNRPPPPCPVNRPSVVTFFCVYFYQSKAICKHLFSELNMKCLTFCRNNNM
uniref:ADAM metallopeptidase domain 19b n=1 Tax=Scophthalmus maximus TaxID=52904 RepID=A0A8D3D090_SCOMX